MVKKQIEQLDNDELEIRAVSVNRNFVSVTYESDLSNEDVQKLFVNKLDNKELFGIEFDTDSLHDSNEMVKVIKFRLR